MEATAIPVPTSAASTTAVSGASSDASTPAPHEDDARHGHFAVVASAASKATAAAMSPGMLTGATPFSTSPSPVPSPEMAAPNVKEPKSAVGSRFHDDCESSDLPSPRLRSSRAFKGKGKEAVPIEKEKKRPLRLLDLPLDILKEIVKEVTHTNDLTSLSLCHSALHRLTIPHIYSRFDIVWPDSTTHSEPRSGVDALTYGLATLVMAEEVFGEAPGRQPGTLPQPKSNRFAAYGRRSAAEIAVRRRRGNHYAHFTKKFSLGNGPADWVQEYLITKEGGKMLGTLVALAVARMRSLETFVWDMPTGILRDVWLALSSLGDRDGGKDCRLEKVWVRWHDNSSADGGIPIAPVTPAPLSVPSIPSLISGSASIPRFHPSQLDRVEHPSFSVLPALKSLSVLDIDELAYLDEMAVLIGKSLDKLRELRVGIARHALTRDWVTVWEGENLKQVDADYPTLGSITIGEKRLGGVLGTLTGLVTDMRGPKMTLPDRTRTRRGSSRASAAATTVSSGLPTTATPTEVHAITQTVSGDVAVDLDAGASQIVSNGASAVPADSVCSKWVAQQPVSSMSEQDPSREIPDGSLEDTPVSFCPQPEMQDTDLAKEQSKPYLDHRLHLESLELERVHISVPVLQKALNWSSLTSLTLLHCPNHEQLWKTLRKQFAPTPKSPTYSAARRTCTSSPRKTSKASMPPDGELQYYLNLTKVHTNTVSPALISFLKETLAPNTLRVLFLQEARSYNSPVQIDTLLRGPIRRHRSSLQKLLIDSSEKSPDNGIPTNSSRWRRWLLNRDTLAFICSGKMTALKELGVAIDYRDWHFFLQSLPLIPQLRSLYLPFLADHVHGTALDPRELALQIVDIVTLRPDVEICYLGIANKCFEILENRKDDHHSRPDSSLGILPAGVEDVGPEDDDDEDEEQDIEDEDDEDAAEEDETESDEDDFDDDDEDDDGDNDDDTDSEGGVAQSKGKGGPPSLRLREILFYDDKVAIFKARHGRL